MLFKPHEYQKYCIQRIIDTKKVGLFIDMGLGKTITTLTAVKELKYNRFEVRKVLVIAPKKLQKERGLRRRISGSIQSCFGYPRFLAARRRE